VHAAAVMMNLCSWSRAIRTRRERPGLNPQVASGRPDNPGSGCFSVQRLPAAGGLSERGDKVFAAIFHDEGPGPRDGELVGICRSIIEGFARRPLMGDSNGRSGSPVFLHLPSKHAVGRIEQSPALCSARMHVKRFPGSAPERCEPARCQQGGLRRRGPRHAALLRKSSRNGGENRRDTGGTGLGCSWHIAARATGS